MQEIDKRYLNAEQIENIGRTAINKTFREISDGAIINDSSKGGLGNFIEQNLFHYEINSDKNPDFQEAGIELKVTPFKKIGRGKTINYSAKERLVLDIINYETEYQKTFETSQFWHKNAHLYIMFYEYIKGVSKYDLKIRFALLYEYSEVDLMIIKNDWNIIIDKIKNGLAHELSESDTMYLGACQKGKNKDSLRSQPMSPVKAMQRAYCLKQSYMTSIVRKYIAPKMQESLVTASEIHEKSFEEVIKEKFAPYKGVSEKILIEKFAIPKCKNKFELIAAAILGIKGKISDTEEFQKAGIKLKTVRIQYNGTVEQSISFPSFDFCSLVNQEWESSELREQFETTKYMFVGFQEIAPNSRQYALEKIVMWNLPIKNLDNEVKQVWLKTVDVLKSGNILTGKVTKRGRENNFPKISQNPICHVRPHGADMKTIAPIPVPDKITGATAFTKQCFWINASYIAKLFE